MRAYIPSEEATRLENFLTLVLPDGTQFQVRKDEIDGEGSEQYLNSVTFLHVFPSRKLTPGVEDVPNHPDGAPVEVSGQVMSAVYAARKQQAA